mgnify:CR=1 FL=1
MSNTLKKIYSLLAPLLFLSSLIRAQDFQKIGTTGYVFLELPVTARYVGMGETGISMPNASAEGLFWNPALIPLGGKKAGLAVSHADWYVETTLQAFGLIYDIPLFGTLGLQAVNFDFGEIQKTINPTASQTGSYIDLGTYTAGAYAIGLSYARSLTNKFSFGTTLKYVRETIDIYNSDNVIADIGFMYFTGFKSLRIAAFLQNFGLESKYETEKFKMPQQLKMGISAEVFGNTESANRLTLLAEALHPNDANERIHLGMEALLYHSVILRAGYKFGYDEENLCAGAGLRFDFAGNSLRFDFAYMNHEHLDSTLRYTLAMEL